MNGTRTNQFDAPDQLITSISRRRANVAKRIVSRSRTATTRAARRQEEERHHGSSASR